MAKIKVYQEVKKYHTVELLAEISTTLENKIDLEDLADTFKYARYPLKGRVFAVIEEEGCRALAFTGYRTIDEYHSYSELNMYKIVDSWV